MEGSSNNQTGHPFPVPYLSTEVSDRLIQQILEAFNREGLTSGQAREVLRSVRELVDVGELVARKSSH
jgi:hypothetical protein